MDFIVILQMTCLQSLFTMIFIYIIHHLDYVEMVEGVTAITVLPAGRGINSDMACFMR